MTRPEGAPLRLPHRVSLEQLKNQARDLQRSSPTKLGRADALHAVARAYGWSTWPRLKAHVETVNRFTREPHHPGPDRDDADRLLRLATLSYGGDDLKRFDEARALLAARPELAGASVYTLAAAADAAGLEALLAEKPEQARIEGGPHRWEPLLYLAYSRLGIGDPVAAARALLRAGADPDAGYLWEGLASPFTALTGAFGEGEDGRNQPRHPAAIELARALLEAGADPNDAQALYNRHFRPADDHLELLFAFGLGRGDGGPWKRRLGQALATPTEQLEDQLLFAVGYGYSARVALLLRHGVDPDGQGTRHPVHRGQGALALARAHGHGEVEALLLAAGATAPEPDPVEALLNAAMRADPAVLEASPELAAAAKARRPGQAIVAAGLGRSDAVRLLLGLGFDPNHRERTTALHEVAWRADRALVELLLSLGADPTIRDTEFDATPAGWADHNGHPELALFLREQEAQR